MMTALLENSLTFSYERCLANFHLKNFPSPTSVRILWYWCCNTSATAAAFKREKCRRKWAVQSLVHRLTSICAITSLDMWFHVFGCLQAGQLHWGTGAADTNDHPQGSFSSGGSKEEMRVWGGTKSCGYNESLKKVLGVRLQPGGKST